MWNWQEFLQNWALIFCGLAVPACAAFYMPRPIRQALGRHLSRLLKIRILDRGWNAPPPFPSLGEWEPKHPVLMNPHVKRLVVGREAGDSLEDRTRVPEVRVRAPFLEIEPRSVAGDRPDGLGWMRRPLFQKMLTGRGRW